MTDQLSNQKAMFDIPEDVVYLNCASQGPLLQISCRAGQESVMRKAQPWDAQSRDRTADEIERCRSAYGLLIGSEADNIALVHSTSYGIKLAAESLPVLPGQNIVVIEDQFPSNFHAWHLKTREVGAKLTIVPTPDDWDWTSAILAHINCNTAIVATAPCRWTDGSSIDLVALGRRCREVGAALVVDATQSAGAMELDVNEIDPDFMIASGYKWLLCPYAFSFLYAAPRHHSAQPIEHYTWTLSDTPPLGMMRGDDMDGASGARRFDMGERNNPILPAMAISALEQLIEWRLERISRSVEILTDLVEVAALDRGMLMPPKHRRVAHIIGIRRQQGWPEDLQERLASMGVYVSKRGDAMRVSPYLYNEADDVQRLFEAVDHLPAA